MLIWGEGANHTDMKMLNIQLQKWLGFTRYLIIHKHGSVMLEILDEPQFDGTAAYVCALWVHPDHRRQGVATRLMNAAEELARRNGQKSVMLCWHPDEAEVSTYRWYLRRGYVDQRTRSDGAQQMTLQLTAGE